MRLRLLAMFVVLGLACATSAQNNTRLEDSASHDMISSVLDSIDVLCVRQGEIHHFKLNKRSMMVERLDNGSRLRIKAPIKAQLSLDTLNRYNEKVAVTTRAVRDAKLGVILEMGVDCSVGVSEAGLKKIITRFGDAVTEFDTFVANQKETKEDVKGTPGKVPLDIVTGSDDKEFVITFPTYDPKNWETAWKVVWDMETGKQANDQKFKFGKGREGATVLFKIKKAYFKPGQKADWIQVLEDVHPSEFYVPYYFRGTRFYDLRGVGGYVPLSEKEGSQRSQLLSKGKRVMAELRDTGPAYKHGKITRRGEELTLWANFGAANYTYMIEYGFRDDGGIVFRHAPTGYNYFNHIDASHMHGSYWRVGIKLGPEGNNETNQVFSVRLPTDPMAQGDKGKMNIEEITQESFLDWSPQEFTRIRVTNPNYSLIPEGKDRPALPISYDLVTYPQGIARHERFKDEKFSLHDFWITRHDCPEKMYIFLGDYFFTPKGEPNPQLRPLAKQNVVLWHSSSALHTPRTEDGILGGNNLTNGQALIYWTTFELRPRNIFVRTPIYRSLP